ncbi:MAG: protein kinase, partial [bacterium]
MTGKIISHYRILEKLGEGGMGVVYKAQDTRLERTVALKFLSAELTDDAEAVDRFINEALAASAFDHANICTVYEIDETEERQLFICIAYYEGQTLKDQINGASLPTEEALDITVQIARGLQRAHEAGIIHRDIKPSNIILTTRGEVKIIDFGIAKLAGNRAVTKSGTTLGTVAYMAPEQLHGETVDRRADIWSLGVVLFEMLTGKRPFQGDNEAAVMYSIVHEDAEPFTGFRTGVPMELERMLNKALTKNAQQRYQRVDEMLTDLKRLRTETETSSKLPTSRYADRDSGRKLLRKVTIPVGIALFLVLGFLLLGFFLFKQVVVPEPTPIAVISFENMTGDSTYDYLQKVIPNLLITSLEQSPYLRVASWERLHDLSKQTGREDVEIIDKKLGFELCHLDGIPTIVVGSFARMGAVFVTDVKVLDVASKRILKSASAKGEGVTSILKSQINEISMEISKGIGLSEHKIEAIQQPITEITTTSLDAYRYFIRGRDEYEKYNPGDAKKFLEKAIQFDSTFASAYLYLARVYARLRDTKAQNQAQALVQKYAEKTTEKERLYIEAATEGNKENRFRILKEAIAKYPKEKRFYYAIASSYHWKGLPDKRIEVLEKALELDPNYGMVLNDLAYTYFGRVDFDKAIEYLERYASAYPGDSNPLDSMGEMYFRMGKLDEAIKKYKETVEIGSGISWRPLAYVFALKEDYMESLKWSEKTIAKVQSTGVKAEGHLLKGFLHYWLGSLNRALGEC